MNSLALLASLSLPIAVQSQATDPMRLPIGIRGDITIQPLQLVDTARDRQASVGDIVSAARGKQFVFLGESHTNAEHHKFQAQIIEALARSGRPVVVGFEMFTRPVQDELNPWTLGWESEDEFVRNSDWKHQWGYDFALYRPIFDVIRDNKLPMVALNIPRDWVRQVGKAGFGALTEDEKSQLPTPLGVPNPIHRKVFEAMIGGHPMSGASMDNMYSAQVLWDEAMGDSALKYLSSHPMPADTVFVVICGSGHVMYGQGINWRIERRTAAPELTVVMVDGPKAATVSRGIADFVFCGGEEAG